MKVVGAFFVVLGLVVFSGIVFSYFNDSILFSPDERWSNLIILEGESRYVQYHGVEYELWLDFVSQNEDYVRFGVRNLETGENWMSENIRVGQTKRVGGLRVRVRVIEYAPERNFIGAAVSVTGVLIEDRCIEPPRGLVSWWPGENKDDIWDGNNGFAPRGIGNVPGKVGDAFEFNGVGHYIEVPDADNLDVTSITIDAWINADNLDEIRPIINKGSAFDLSVQDREGGGLRCNFRTEGSNYSLGMGSNVSLEGWNHVACTYDERTGIMEMYINGIPGGGNRRIAPNNTKLQTNNNPLFMGKDDEDYFKGLIDEVEIHNVALSEEEIKAIYDAGSYGKCKEENPTHTTCEENSCVVVEGEGSNECLTNEDCTHLECVANACQIVSGQGEDQCGPGKPPCGGEEWHYACVGNRGCVLTPGPGPDTCGPEELCPAIGNPGGTD